MLRIENETVKSHIELLRLVGSLDGLTSPDLLKAFNSAIDNSVTRIVLDMTEVNYVSSGGLRVLLMGAKKLKERDGEIVLFGMNQTVNEVFKLSGFEQLFSSFDSEEEATGSI